MDKNLRQKAKSYILAIKSELNILEKELAQQTVDIKNKRFIKLTSVCAQKETELKFIEKILERNKQPSVIVAFGSRVQLISTKIGAIIFVDARNYFELVGKKVGDLVVMNNSQFMIAGVY